MTTLVDVPAACTGFSCPSESFSSAIFESIAIDFSREVALRFVDRYSTLLSDRCTGLSDVVRHWADQGPDFEAAWEPIYGVLGEILAGRSVVDPATAAVRLLLANQASGAPGRWSATLPAPTVCRWGGATLPETVEIGAESDGNLARLTLVSANRDRTTLSLTRNENGRWIGAGVRESPSVQIDRNQLFLIAGNEATTAPEFEFLKDDLAQEEQVIDVTSRYQEAFATLRRYAPVYLEWIDRVMRYVIPLRGGPNRIVSGSTRGDLGVSHISCDAAPIALAEMLVHESSHQYYYLATRISPVADGTDDHLYYSPIKQRGRPIHYIHLAHHAFGNVVVMGRLMRKNGYKDKGGYLAQNEADLLPQLEQLEAGLLATNSLTSMGRALWKPLSGQLRA